MAIRGFERGQITGQAAAQSVPQPSRQAPKKDFWTDQISTGGGIGGALGGAAAGAALGSVVPVIGTAIGGLAGGILGGALGSGAGELGENIITGEQDRFKNVGQEALLGGVFSAPPVRLARGLIGAGKAAGTGGAKAAFEKGFIGTVDKNAKPGFISNLGSKTYAQAFNLPRRFTGKLQPEETAKKLIKYGISGGLDKIETTSTKALGTLGGILDNSVSGIGGDVKVGNVTDVFKNLEKFNIPKGEIQALRATVTDVGTTGRNLGFENPSAMLDKIRELEKRGYDLVKAGESNLAKNPNQTALGEAYLQASQELEDNLYTAITSKGTLKALQTEANQTALNNVARGLGDEFMQITDPKELRTLMSPFVRAKQLAQLTRDEAQGALTQGLGGLGARGAGGGIGAIGGLTLGGPVGAAVGGLGGFLAAPLVRGAQEAAQAPISTTVGRGISKLAGNGAPQTPARMATGGAVPLTARQGIGRAVFGEQEAQPSLEQALSQQSFGAPAQSQDAFGIGQAQQTEQTNPYPRENLLYDIQRDPANADAYIERFAQLQEIFAPAQQESTLNPTQATRATSALNALQDLPLIQQAIESGTISSFGRKLPGADTPLGRNILGTENLDAALFNIADNILRARTGAAAPEAEIRRFMDSFLPNAFDSPTAQRQKLERAVAELQGFVQPVQSTGGGLEDALLQAQQQGAF